jgi:hypothetical protein
LPKATSPFTANLAQNRTSGSAAPSRLWTGGFRPLPPVNPPANTTTAAAERHETDQHGGRTPIRLRRLLESLIFPAALRHRADQQRLADVPTERDAVSRRLTVGNHLLRQEQIPYADMTEAVERTDFISGADDEMIVGYAP